MDPRLIDLDQALLDHAKNKDFGHAQKVVNAILGLFRLQVGTHDWDKPFTDNGGKLRANAGWFMNAPGYADRRATYILANKNAHNIDFKAFWLKKTSKSVISWLVALTPNFEDRPYYKKENLGIDFIIPEAADKVLVVLSNNFTLRTLELSEKLSKTDLEIFSKWIQPLDFSNKEQVHTVLWESFDFEPVNRIFYKKISELFVDLKQHLVNKNLFDDKHASYFANRLIGRVIFCWFLDKKGIINPKMGYFNTNNQDSTTYYHTKLEPLFFHTLNTPISMRDEQANQPQPDLFPDDKPKNLFNYTADLITPFLNGGLFEPRANDLAGNSKLTFPADYFDRLYEHLHHYHFTTDESTSDYQQVAIDPEMLGRIFENLLAEQSEDTGEQARKAKGAFYTPREIVDYMCRESLRQYLKSQLPQSSDLDQRMSELLDIKTHEYRDQQRNYQANLKPYKEDLMKALDNLKVLDPACGSGAFPMGMQQLLLNVYERLDTRLDPYRTKIGILKNNIYGVDIEPMAVEISRLRAWLSIIVDQDPHTKIEALPNLDFKFVCANSLLPLASNGQLSFADHQELESEQKQLRDAYFGTTDHEEKLKLKTKYTDLVTNKLVDGFDETARILQLKSYNPFDSENVTTFFDPDFMFGEKSFDVIVGNPPYVSALLAKKIIDKTCRDKYKEIYVSATGTYDLYVLFFERGSSLLKKHGILSFISPSKYLSAKYAESLRSGVFSKYSLHQVVDFSNTLVFKSAGVSTLVTFIKNDKQDEHIRILHPVFSKANINMGNENIYLAKDLTYFPEQIWGPMLSQSIQLVKKIWTQSESISAYGKVNASSTAGEADEYSQYISENNNLESLKIINSGTIDHLKSRWGLQEMKNKKNKYLKPYLDLTNISDRRVKMYKTPKIIFTKIASSMTATLDLKGEYASTNTNFIYDIKDYNIYLLAAYYNSKIADYLYKQLFAGLNMFHTFQFQAPQLRIFPIPKQGYSSIENKIVEVVKKMLSEEINTDSSKYDEYFYDLYDLSSSEVQIIEQGSVKNKSIT